MWSPTRDLWALLVEHGADAVFSGDHHHYERSGRLAPDGSAGTGPRQFIVGTGGMAIDGTWEPPYDEGQVVDYQHHGVLQLDLGSESYAWSWISTDGVSRDTGSDGC